MNKKKILKIIGGALTLLALFFIVKRLLELDVDYSLIFQQENIAILIAMFLVYGGLVIVSGLPWGIVLRILIGHKLPLNESIWIFNKANLMKYIPGNVFQYVGRNELAVKLDLRHVDVAFSTMFDTVINVLSVFIVALVTYSDGIALWFQQYHLKDLWFIWVVIAAACIIVGILFWKKRIALKNYLSKLKVFVQKKSILKIALCIAIDIAISLGVAALFLVVLKNMLAVEISPNLVPVVIGSYFLSWIAGFIVPGSPGGIGVREATLTLLLGGVLGADNVLLAAVIYRVITTLGDFVSLLFAYVGKKIYQYKHY